MAASTVVFPAPCLVGPPAPWFVSWLARATMVALIAVVGRWVSVDLGGASTRVPPADPKTGANDTSKLFNWHPVLMTLAFGVFMAEAVLTYQAPALPSLPRPGRKKVHVACHALAATCALLGAVAAFQSHNLKLPSPIPNLYSPHSYLGLLALMMLSFQFVVGFGSYLYPGISLPGRLALGPLHKFAGKATWVTGLAAMAVGLQEKVTFVQAGKQLSGEQLFSSVVRLPAVAQLLLVLLAVLVLFHQEPPAKPLVEDERNPREREALLAGLGQP